MVEIGKVRTRRHFDDIDRQDNKMIKMIKDNIVRQLSCPRTKNSKTWTCEVNFHQSARQQGPHGRLLLPLIERMLCLSSGKIIGLLLRHSFY